MTLGIFMSKAKFESLPPQAKAAIEKNRGEALSRAFGKMSEDRNAELIAEWKKDPKRTRHRTDQRRERGSGTRRSSQSCPAGSQGRAQQEPVG